MSKKNESKKNLPKNDLSGKSSLSLESLLHNQLKHSGASRVLLALSGGLDSNVLLHCLVGLKSSGQLKQLRALHVNHGLQSCSQDWLVQCKQNCDDYGVEFVSASLNMGAEVDTDVERQAREGRYQVFSKYLEQDEVLLLAHHQNDQAETLLFRLLRGCGLDGASAMPRQRKIGKSWLLRPFLDVTRRELENYARQNQLTWIDDPSNQSVKYSRNFLRQQVIPLLETRWPSMINTLARFTELAQEQKLLLMEVAAEDLQQMSRQPDQIEIEKIEKLSPQRQKNLLHYWGKLLTEMSPSSVEIDQLLTQMKPAKNSAIEVRFSTGIVRSYGGMFYFCQHSEPDMLKEKVCWTSLSLPLILSNQVEIHSEQQPAILAANDKIEKIGQNKIKVRLPGKDEKVWVDSRRGGERCCPAERNHSADLKKIYQELNIPPWQRQWLPIIYYNDQIVAVPGIFVCNPFVCPDDEQGIIFNLA